LKREIKRAIKEARVRRQIRQAIGRAATLSPEQLLSADSLAELYAAWGNEDFAARSDYLMAVGQYARTTRGPILECGSGLSTLLLAFLAARRGIEVWSLEHVQEWHRRLRTILKSLDTPQARLLFSPLRSYEGFDWYDPPLASMPKEFRLVICDGPPGSTRGGRYGLLPIMGERLPKGAVVLVDDAERPGEQDMIRRWAIERGWSAAIDERSSGTLAIISV